MQEGRGPLTALEVDRHAPITSGAARRALPRAATSQAAMLGAVRPAEGHKRLEKASANSASWHDLRTNAVRRRRNCMQGNGRALQRAAMRVAHMTLPLVSGPAQAVCAPSCCHHLKARVAPSKWCIHKLFATALASRMMRGRRLRGCRPDAFPSVRDGAHASGQQQPLCGAQTEIWEEG